MLATSPLPYGWSPTRWQNQKRPTRVRIGYISPAVQEVPVKGTKSDGSDQMAYMWVDWLHHPCLLESHPQGGKLRSGPHADGLATSPLPSGGSPSRGLNHKGPQVGGLATSPLPSGGPQQRKQIYKRPRVSGLATSPLPSGGSPTGVQNHKGRHVGVLAISPLPSGESATRGQTRKWPTCGRIGYITPTIWGVLYKGTKSERDHMLAH